MTLLVQSFTNQLRATNYAVAPAKAEGHSKLAAKLTEDKAALQVRPKGPGEQQGHPGPAAFKLECSLQSLWKPAPPTPTPPPPASRGRDSRCSLAQAQRCHSPPLCALPLFAPPTTTSSLSHADRPPLPPLPPLTQKHSRTGPLECPATNSSSQPHLRWDRREGR